MSLNYVPACGLPVAVEHWSLESAVPDPSAAVVLHVQNRIALKVQLKAAAVARGHLLPVHKSKSLFELFMGA